MSRVALLVASVLMSNVALTTSKRVIASAHTLETVRSLNQTAVSKDSFDALEAYGDSSAITIEQGLPKTPKGSECWQGPEKINYSKKQVCETLTDETVISGFKTYILTVPGDAVNPSAVVDWQSRFPDKDPSATEIISLYWAQQYRIDCPASVFFELCSECWQGPERRNYQKEELCETLTDETVISHMKAYIFTAPGDAVTPSAVVDWQSRFPDKDPSAAEIISLYWADKYGRACPATVFFGLCSSNDASFWSKSFG